MLTWQKVCRDQDIYNIYVCIREMLDAFADIIGIAYDIGCRYDDA